MVPTAEPHLILTLSCPDQPGIVTFVSGVLARSGFNIVESQQFMDSGSETFFMRVEAVASQPAADDWLGALSVAFEPGARELEMDWQLNDAAVRPKALIMVSRYGHCLNDLLFRWRSASLTGEIAAVVSNHTDFEAMVTSYGLPFHHVPVSPGGKAAAEAQLLDLVAQYDIDLVILARYMQVLSDDLCQKLSGRIINIHHSFLPSFKGGHPYRQAYERGVKLIGATAHYVTADLDEGPIIEQDVLRIDHRQTPEQLAAVGRDVEAGTLARATQWHLARRVMSNGLRTVVFA
jgi:formyltetrahydrofolate deformylase